MLTSALLKFLIACFGFAHQQPSHDDIRVVRNYAAEFNAQIDALPSETLAWPLYQRARDLLPFHDLGEDMSLNHVPGTESWARMCAWLEAHQDGLRLLREASARPRMGYRVSGVDNHSVAPVTPQSPGGPAPAARSGENPAIVDWGLPHIGFLRASTRILANDAMFAAGTGDADRAAADVEAIIKFSRHAAEPNTIIAHSAAVAMRDVAYRRLLSILTDYTGLLTEAHLVQLSHCISDVDTLADVQDALRWERMVLEDVVQRIFTDDGAGDGEFVPGPWAHLSPDMSKELANLNRAPHEVTNPITRTAVESSGVARRMTLLQEHADLLQIGIDAASIPASDPAQPSFDQAWQERAQDLHYDFQISLVRALSADVDQCVETAQRHENLRRATLTAVAIHRFRLARGQFPPSIDDLTPEFLSDPPEDWSDGRPFRYRLQDDRPLLYSLGADRDDDGGRPTPQPRHAERAPRPGQWESSRPEVPDPDPYDGDWVFLPLPPSR